MAGLSGQTVTGGTAGTPVFMSRKQLLNFKYCQPDVDVWAVAACFYYLLTGQFPRDFRRGDPLQIILTSPTIPIGQRGIPIPPRLAAVIDRALNEGDGTQPLAFSTAIDFQRALKDALI
jgi:serine/threonine protein kinase